MTERPEVTYEVWDNSDPATKKNYPFEVVAIAEDGSESMGLFSSEIQATNAQRILENLTESARQMRSNVEMVVDSKSVRIVIDYFEHKDVSKKVSAAVTELERAFMKAQPKFLMRNRHE